MDASIISLISLCVTSLTAVVLAWIAYKQASLSRNLQTLKEQTNHIKDALVASTAKASHAEGVAEGKAAAAAAVPPQP